MTDNQATPGGDDRTGVSSPMPGAGSTPEPVTAAGPTSGWARPAEPSASSEPTAPVAGSPAPAYPVPPAPGAVPTPPAAAAPTGSGYDPRIYAAPRAPQDPRPQQAGAPSYPGYPPSGQPTGVAAPHAAAHPYGQPAGYPGQPPHYQPYQQTWQIPIPQGAGQTQPLGLPVPGQPRQPMSPGVRRGLVAGAAALAIALTAGGVGGFVGYSLHPNGSPLQVSAQTGNGTAAPVIDRSSLASIAAALQPAIVDITTSEGEGSGVVISADGNIATNNHVVTGAHTVKVTFNSGKSVTGTVVGADAKTDLAVVKVDATGLSFAKWGDSDSVQVGDTVLAIGSPLGLQGSVTAGIVSALHRTITVSDNQGTQGSQSDSSATTIGDAIQTDAPINPGNSGGALVNTNGEVIGINSAIATSGSNGNIGVGFAISANRAKAVTSALAAGQKVSHPYVGVKISDAASGGANVDEVVSGSPADKAGIQSGDVITKVGSRTIRGSEDLIGAIQASSVGQNLQVTVQRNGSDKTVTLTVGEQ